MSTDATTLNGPPVPLTHGVLTTLLTFGGLLGELPELGKGFAYPFMVRTDGETQGWVQRAPSTGASVPWNRHTISWHMELPGPCIVVCMESITLALGEISAR